jgi:DNA polymerase
MSMDATNATTINVADDKRRALALIAKQVGSCRDCALCQGRTNAVPGEGDANAQIMFIGEGPGFYEDQQGRPFVGASGKFLDELLRGIGLDRKKVFIANVVKCRPPQNRDPQADEIEACGKHLDAQIAAIAPKVIVTLGRHSMQRYFPGESVSKIHGQPRRKGDLIVVPMYHPAAALHQGNLRKVIEADFGRLPGFLAKVLGGETPAAAMSPAPVPSRLRASTTGAPSSAPQPAAAAEAAQPESQQMRLL